MLSSWLIISLQLCVFGFLKEIRPSEPFIYEFLIGEWRNVTQDEVNQQVYPAGIYSYMSLLIVVFLVTDLTRYKPLIIFLGISGIIVWSMLLWTKTLRDLLILEVFYGAFMACEVAYYTYIYAKVDKQYYQQVTSHTRAAILAGRAISGILGQLLISFDVMDYRQLNYITLGAVIAATLWSFLLPPIKKSIYFHQEDSALLNNRSKAGHAFQMMWGHFKHAYSNKYTLKWSIWFSVTTCGFVQVQTYMQPLWNAITSPGEERDIYNGAIESVLTIIGFLGALFAGVLTKVNWRNRGELLLSACSLIQGGLMIISSQTHYLWVSYASYVVFGAIFHFVITIVSSEIAKQIDEDSYGLIFGLNTFLALVFQTILTLIVVSAGGFALAPRGQFLVYGVFHLVLGVIFIVINIIEVLIEKKYICK
ncbi:hypothetical protein ABEB36_013908 [Hypothenemus hampei]|uniref:Uncharacterized protein n=1 Tax=Hypothenemus hampei TaxID=57062 RepID=A0ABD1E6L3_HYPHA